ncbi:DUF2002 family protein [Salmonella enterica subsp. enterica]|nr:DUF2002 family protein [Salmonella enterica subsp. enterica]
MTNRRMVIDAAGYVYVNRERARMGRTALIDSQIKTVAHRAG